MLTLREFFKKYECCALGYSGGVDSAYLLYEAVKSNVDVKPYFVRSSFTTTRELEDAARFAENLGCKLEIIDVDILSFDCVKKNAEDRCYHCKKTIFNEICARAEIDGYDVVLEGTNASDDVDDRPGFKAITELGVLSPLKLCGLTKAEIREQLRAVGFSLWNRPATACLATRIPFGTEISAVDLKRVVASENVLSDMGFFDFRIRLFHNAARIQLKPEQFDLAVLLRSDIVSRLGQHFDEVFLDLKER